MIELPAGRPLVVALAGPNGAGKSTFYEAFLSDAGLRFVNSDRIAQELDIDAYAAAALASDIRAQLVAAGESFVFETVLSDPEGAKVAELARWHEQGCAVVLCFIGLGGPELSDERVAMRVTQGGHDVPPEKIVERYPRILANLVRAIAALPHVLVYDNSDLSEPYRRVATYRDGITVELTARLPDWFEALAAR